MCPLNSDGYPDRLVLLSVVNNHPTVWQEDRCLYFGLKYLYSMNKELLPMINERNCGKLILY